MVSHCACPTRVFRDRALHEHRRPSSLPSLPPSSLVLSQGWGLIDLPLRATFSPAHPLARRDVPLAQARASCFFSVHIFKGAAGLSFTARIERAQFHRARSASKKDGLAAPFLSF